MSDADHRDSDRRADRKRELISQEAAEWFARMKDPHVPLDERRRFVRWLKQSQVHVAEYLTVAGIDGDVRRAQLPLTLTSVFPSNVVALFAGASERPAASSDVAPVRWKVAAALAVCGLAALLFFGVRTAWTERSIATELGEWKTATLADGSELQLGPNTLLKFDLGDAQRTVALVRGEAYFKVAKDPPRPFVVEAKAYAVRGSGHRVCRLPSQGRIARHCERGPGEGGAARQVSEVRRSRRWAVGAERAHRGRPATADRRHVACDSRLASTFVTRSRGVTRQLMFQPGDTLADAVEEFNLRNRVQLRIDPRAATLPVRGSFPASDPVAFAQSIDKTSPVAVRRLAANTLLIQAE